MAAKKKAAPKKKAALAPTTKGGAIATYDYGENAGVGYENQTQADIAIPFLSVLQTNSPEVDKNHAKHVEGAEAGMLFNTVSKMLFSGDDGMILVPCDTSHVFVEWLPRTEGGGGGVGFRGVHEIGSDIVKAAKLAAAESGAFGKLPTPDKTELVETFYIAVLVLDSVDADEPSEMLLLPMTSTKIKAYKSIMYRLRMFKGRPPLFANRLRATTYPDKNAKGSFYSLKVEPAVDNDVASSLVPPTLGDAPHPILVAGKAFMEQIRSGLARGAYESVESPGDDDASGDGVF